MEEITNKDISFLVRKIRREASRMKMTEKGLTFWLILMIANGESKIPE